MYEETNRYAVLCPPTHPSPTPPPPSLSSQCISPSAPHQAAVIQRIEHALSARVHAALAAVPNLVVLGNKDWAASERLPIVSFVVRCLLPTFANDTARGDRNAEPGQWAQRPQQRYLHFNYVAASWGREADSATLLFVLTPHSRALFAPTLRLPCTHQQQSLARAQLQPGRATRRRRPARISPRTTTYARTHPSFIHSQSPPPSPTPAVLRPHRALPRAGAVEKVRVV